MTQEAVTEVLRHLEFTRDLKPEDQAKLASISTHVTFSEGSILFNEGDISELVYLIEVGRIVLLTLVPGHGQVKILEVGPGELLGWSSLFGPQRKTASAKAIEAAHVIAIHAPQLRELCRVDTELGFNILWRVANVISDRLRAARAQLLDMFEPARRKNPLAG